MARIIGTVLRFNGVFCVVHGAAPGLRRPPVSLNSKRVPVPGLAAIDHAYSVEEVRQLRAQRISVSSTSAGNTSASAQEREWVAKAEARILPR